MNKKLFVPLCAVLLFSCRGRQEGAATWARESRTEAGQVQTGENWTGQNQGPRKTFTDALGRVYTINNAPRRIVSLSPAATEILFAIGAGDRVVGVTSYCDYPPEARRRKVVGGFSGATVSVEQIRSLKADLVVLSADMHGRIVTLLDELGIHSFAVEPRNFSQVYDTISLLGELTGFTGGAGGVILDMKGKIAAVMEQVRGKEKQSVFWVLSLEPLLTSGAGTFVSEAISLGGGANIFGDTNELWPQISVEQVILRKPGWILMGGDMIAGTGDPGSLIRGNPLWQSIPAVKNGRILVISGDTVYRYGPRLAEAVELIAMILHGGDSR